MLVVNKLFPVLVFYASILFASDLFVLM